MQVEIDQSGNIIGEKRGRDPGISPVSEKRRPSVRDFPDSEEVRSTDASNSTVPETTDLKKKMTADVEMSAAAKQDAAEVNAANQVTKVS